MSKKCEKEIIFLEENLTLAVSVIYVNSGRKKLKRKAAQGGLILLKLKETRQLPGLERGADLTGKHRR